MSTLSGSKVQLVKFAHLICDVKMRTGMMAPPLAIIFIASGSAEEALHLNEIDKSQFRVENRDVRQLKGPPFVSKFVTRRRLYYRWTSLIAAFVRQPDRAGLRGQKQWPPEQ